MLFVMFYVLLFGLLARSTINLDVGLYLCNVEIMDFRPVKHSCVLKYIYVNGWIEVLCFREDVFAARNIYQ